MQKYILYFTDYQLLLLFFLVFSNVELPGTLIINWLGCKHASIFTWKCTEPIKDVRKVYAILNFKYVPFYRKKIRSPAWRNFKNDTS